MASPGLLDAILRCPPAAGWDDLRTDALGRLQGADLPTPRQEDWKYLDLRALRETTFQPCAEGAADIREHILPEAIGSRLVFVNGRLDDQARTQFYGNRSLPMLEEELVLAFNRALGEAT